MNESLRAPLSKSFQNSVNHINWTLVRHLLNWHNTKQWMCQLQEISRVVSEICIKLLVLSHFFVSSIVYKLFTEIVFTWIIIFYVRFKLLKYSVFFISHYIALTKEYCNSFMQSELKELFYVYAHTSYMTPDKIYFIFLLSNHFKNVISH